MEHEAADPNKEIPEVGNAEYSVVTISAAGADAEKGKVNEEQVSEGVDDLGGIVG